MARIKVTEDVLSKAIYEGVAEAMLPDGQEQNNVDGILHETLVNFENVGEKLITIGEQLTKDIIPEIKNLYADGVSIAKRVLGDGLNLSAVEISDLGRELSVEIPVTSFDYYKSFLTNNKHKLDEILADFALDTTKEELSSENYEIVKRAFFNDEEWLAYTIDDVLDEFENEINCRYSTINITYATTRKAVLIEIEYPYDISNYERLINGEN